MLGGSFNPAHEGHLHITRLALADLGLDGVWWLVSPQNPLKSVSGMASYERRLASARAVAADPRIRVCDFERKVGATQTARVLRKLTRAYRNRRFVWLMGADNLVQIARWHDWPSIFTTVPIAVYDRPSYSEPALASTAARRFGRARVNAVEAASLADRRPPAWIFFRGRLDATSATEIRARWRRAEKKKENIAP